MGDVVDPGRASIDGLIDWLREQRAGRPTAKLTELLCDHRFQADRLVDLACIDLIQRRRMGHAVRVETYLDEFPRLRADADRLDLIDAELCVADELGRRDSVEQYIARFPDLAEPVRELFHLDGAAPAMIDAALDRDANRPTEPLANAGHASTRRDDSRLDRRRSCPSSQDTACDSGEFSIETTSRSSAFRNELPSPVDVPDWFVAQKCIASRPGRWLFQGRDANRGSVLGLKVIELPTDLTAAEQEEILDGCEASTRVRHQAWTKPCLAAIQNRRLAVIRPWAFAQPWHQASLRGQHENEMRVLSSVAFAIQSAHDAGASHGGIQPENLLVDHANQVRVVDAIGNAYGIRRWLRCRPGSDVSTESVRQARIDLDVQGLMKVIVSAAVEWPHPWATQLAGELREIARGHRADACAQIGELLLRRADNDLSPGTGGRCKTATGKSWPARLKDWLRSADAPNH
jgi:hypothetical protein